MVTPLAWWIVAASLVIPAVLMLLLWRTRVYWLPSVLPLVLAAAAYVYGILLVLVPLLVTMSGPLEGLAGFADRLVGGLHGVLGFLAGLLLAGILWGWATVLALSGAVVATVTAHWRIRRGLPTRFGAVWLARRRKPATAEEIPTATMYPERDTRT
jgi:hypothetical protein